MMRSLWSGVSGLNAHQVAMDVESNNIANVNTVGFKYSRTNFANLLAQTVKSSTAPQGTLGGKNSLQIGLGTTVSGVETMFKQGSLQNTDKNTDMAINGDGFFVVTDDNAKTYKFTRAGDFTFDANGNFVDPNGLKVVGWLADKDTYQLDTSSGPKPITIPPGLTTPAKETSIVQIKANLNSGDHIIEMDGTRSTLDLNKDMNGIYTQIGEQINLTPGIDTISMKVTDLNGNTRDLKLTYGDSGNNHDQIFKTVQDVIDEINYAISHDSLNRPINKPDLRKAEYEIYINGDGQFVDPRGNQIDDLDSTNELLKGVLKKLNGDASKTSDSLKMIQNSFLGADDVAELFNTNGDAYNLKEGEGIQVKIDGLYENRKFVYTPNSLNGDANSCGTGSGDYMGDPVVADSLEGTHWLYTSDGSSAALGLTRDSNFNVKTRNKVNFTVSDSNGGNSTTYTFLYGTDFNTIDELACALNAKLVQDSFNLTLKFDATKGKFYEEGTASIDDAAAYDDSAGNGPTGSVKNFDSLISGLDGSSTESKAFYKRDTYYFHDIQDLTNLWKFAIDDSNDPTGNINAVNNEKAKVYINDDGKINIYNVSGQSFNITANGYPKDHDNKLFTDTFSPINGTVANGGIAASQQINAAVHVTSMDVFDSLGSKHTLTFHFRKAHTSTNPADPTTWKWYAEVPDPASLDNPQYGDVKFNPDGSLKAVNPPSLIFNPNNGSNPGQAIQLNFGSINGFDGITSFEAPSATSGQTQDGYPGGDLEQLVVDQSGTIIGVFTNGRSYSLAQVALAKFVNNEGLMSEGGTLFSASANSGEPIIGTPGTGGRGTIQPSALEMSNVDLSRSLTELIIIQRGFQANSKTITTSDQMLNTLLQLKQ